MILMIMLNDLIVSMAAIFKFQKIIPTVLPGTNVDGVSITIHDKLTIKKPMRGKVETGRYRLNEIFIRLGVKRADL